MHWGGLSFLFTHRDLKPPGGVPPRLVDVFKMLQEWVEGLGEVFSVPLFVFEPKYSPKKRQTLVLFNFIFASAKLAIWKSRKNKLLEKGWTDPVRCLRGLVAVRLRVEHTYFRLTNNLDGFKAVWAVRQVLCSLGEDGSLVLHF